MGLELLNVTYIDPFYTTPTDWQICLSHAIVWSIKWSQKVPMNTAWQTSIVLVHADTLLPQAPASAALGPPVVHRCSPEQNGTSTSGGCPRLVCTPDHWGGETFDVTDFTTEI